MTMGVIGVDEPELYMLRNITRNSGQRGFTIIEVVLVLAIAGLIFLVVFLALPGLQRGQRDTQRKQEVARLESQITTYQSDNKGSLPVQGSAGNPGYGDKCPTGAGAVDVSARSDGAKQGNFIKDYLNRDSSFVDPSGVDYCVTLIQNTAGSNTGAPVNVGDIYIVNSGTCEDGTVTAGSTGGLKIAYFSEGAGKGVCL